MEESLTLLYTYGIKGQLDLLPRLYTFIRQLKRDLPPTDRTYLIDLGQTCDPEVWPCAVTQGRSTLFVMDAMGYSVANINGQLAPQSYEKLRDQAMIHLVDKGGPYLDHGILFCVGEADSVLNSSLVVMVEPAEANQLVDNTLYLLPVLAGQIGVVQIFGGAARFEVRTMPEGTAIDPTIAGAVDFVRDEARYYEKRHQSNNGDTD